MRTRRLLFGLFVAFGWPGGVCLGQSLEEAASVFAERWRAVEIASLEESLSRGGVRLQWEARQVGSLDPAHAKASIQEYLTSREGVGVSVTRFEEVGGDPPKGYAEIRWESRIRGTSEVLVRTVFVAFVSEDGGWRVTELRVLPLSRS